MHRDNYYEDGILEIVVLGPMGSDDKNVSSSTKQIGTAVESLLEEEILKNLLEITKTKPEKVKIPENWMNSEIINGIMGHVDTADLVIVNITPFDGINGSTSPNVFYEIGLLHALGIPVICVAQKGTTIPFYVRTNRILEVASFDIENIKDALRSSLTSFLDPKDETDFTDNRITQFYGGLPIVDISAAVGLATGYYYNFVGRLLVNGGIISHNKEKVKRLIIVRPHDIMNSYDEDRDTLKQVLSDNGYKLEEERNLTIPEGDDKGAVWVYHVDGVIIDLPRTIYPLKISPRLLSLQERIDKPASFSKQHPRRSIMLKQLSERLLDRVQNVILYHARRDTERFRSKLLEFSTIEQLPDLLKNYGVKPNR